MKMLIGENQQFNQMMSIFHIQLEQVQFIFHLLLKKWQPVVKTDWLSLEIHKMYAHLKSSRLIVLLEVVSLFCV